MSDDMLCPLCGATVMHRYCEKHTLEQSSLRLDRERLDWLEQKLGDYSVDAGANEGFVVCWGEPDFSEIQPYPHVVHKPTLREAIDGAREGSDE